MVNYNPLPVFDLFSPQAEVERLVEKQKTYLVLRSCIGCLASDGNYTDFYFLQPLRLHDGYKKIKICHNIGYYEYLLQAGFTKPSSRFIVNPMHIDGIEENFKITLLYRHPEIRITKTFKNDFNLELDAFYTQRRQLINNPAQLCLFA